MQIVMEYNIGKLDELNETDYLISTHNLDLFWTIVVCSR